METTNESHLQEQKPKFPPLKGVIEFVAENEVVYQDASKKAYNCTLSDGGDAICIVTNDFEKAQYWYKFSMANTNNFLLRMFCKFENKKQLCLVSEKFDYTLEQWKEKFSLWKMDMNYMDQGFADILLDIMQGILYFNTKLKKKHGHICSKTVYIVEGKAKLVDALEGSNCNDTYTEDYNSFAILVEKMLDGLDVIPDELGHFINLSKRVNTPHQFAYLMNHPVLLTPERRCKFRMEAAYTVKSQSLTKDMCNNLSIIVYRQMTFDWASKVTREEFKNLACYKRAQPGPETFFRFGRNACEHVNDKKKLMEEHELDHELNNIWPEFLCALFEACWITGIEFTSLWNK